jgi:F-type H+-transporting ATPase subunit b
MLIDWFTVGAQALNFIILVWLLKRFLYKPILDAIDTREKRVAAELAGADAKNAEAQKDRAEYQLKSEQFEQRRAALLSQATRDVAVERQRLLAEAGAAADAVAAQRLKVLRGELDNLNQAIRQRTQQEVFAIATRALTDLAASSLEERTVEVLMRRLHMLSGSAKDVLAKAVRTASDPVLIRSAFELSGAQRAAVQNAINETFAIDAHVRFETAPELICGIALSTNGQKLAWNIADYLASLEASIAELMCETEKAIPALGPSAEAATPPRKQLAEATSP